MAVIKTSSTERYIGLSTDTKPSAPIGSEFWEHDTGIVYETYDGTNWAVKVDYTVPSVIANQGTVGASPWLVTETSTPITGQSLEAGGVGLLGWLSSIRKAITTPSAIEFLPGLGETRSVFCDWDCGL